jgi:hypothetical protein
VNVSQLKLRSEKFDNNNNNKKKKKKKKKLCGCIPMSLKRYGRKG